MNNGKPFTMLDLCRISPEQAARRIEGLIKQVAELEKEKTELKSLLEKNLSTFINKKEEGILLGIPMFEAYQLEQQAIGAYESVWFCKFEGVRTDEQPNRHISHLLNARVKELRNQAKELEEQE
jgi:hypothetical protein